VEAKGKEKAMVEEEENVRNRTLTLIEREDDTRN
jgi:hypothetical protein